MNVVLSGLLTLSSARYRRQLAAVSLLVLMSACSEESMQVVAEPEIMQPNIIVILADDQRLDSLGMTGHPVIKTPNIDGLASDGVFFSRAFVTSPICTPSRTSILTGQYERKHGITFGSKSALSADAFSRTYPMVLKDNGYYVAWVGKNHTPVGLSDAGIGYDSGAIEVGFDYWFGNHKHMGFYPKERHPVYEGAGPDTQVEIIRDGALNFLVPDADFSAAFPGLQPRPVDKPFAMLINFNVPHANGTLSMAQRPSDPELYRTTYRDSLADMPIPETYIAYDEIETPKFPKHVYANEYINSYSYSKTPETLREHSLREAQTITGIDRVVGALRESLEDLGIADNTIIVYFSDHGVQHGEHGLGGKTLPFEESIRVPFIVFDPRMPSDQRGHQVNELAINLDIYPTLLELAGAAAPGSHQGRSLVPLLEGEADEWREDFFVENMFMGQGYPRAEGVRNERFKYVRYFDREKNDTHLVSLTASIRGEQPIYEELFDLQEDPQETRNLVEDADYAETLSELRERCHELLLEAKGGDGPPDTYIAEESVDGW